MVCFLNRNLLIQFILLHLITLVIGAIWTISSMVGIPDAISLQAQNNFFDPDDPCIQDDLLWDLTTCVPTWDESFDFSFTIVKVSLFIFKVEKIEEDGSLYLQ